MTLEIPEGALFRREGEHFIPTDRARGPWSPDTLHGSPVAALIAFCIEQRLQRSDSTTGNAPNGLPGELRIARQTIDLLRPVPYGRLSVEVEAIREGRRIALFQTRLSCEGKLHTQATTLCLRADSQIESVGAEHTAEPPPPPDEAIPNKVDRVGNRWVSYPGTLEMRHIVPPGGEQPPLVWIRNDAPVLDDAPLSPAVRAAGIADFVSPFANMQPGRSGYVNADITMHPASSAEGRLALPARRFARRRRWSGHRPGGAGRRVGRLRRVLGRQSDQPLTTGLRALRSASEVRSLSSGMAGRIVGMISVLTLAGVIAAAVVLLMLALDSEEDSARVSAEVLAESVARSLLDADVPSLSDEAGRGPGSIEPSLQRGGGIGHGRPQSHLGLQPTGATGPPHPTARARLRAVKSSPPARRWSPARTR